MQIKGYLRKISDFQLAVNLFQEYNFVGYTYLIGVRVVS